ncbi:hypothetical protein KCU91_g5560, partial [Aureobasidium melanogenum]
MSSQPDEVNIPGLHAQILANMRIIEPHVDSPIITTGYDQGLWSGMIWIGEGEVAYCAVGFPSAVDALRFLLQSTSSTVYNKFHHGNT